MLESNRLKYQGILMVGHPPELDETMRGEYRAHAIEELERTEQIILDLESEEITHDVSRKLQLIIHSIKGSSGSYGFDFASSACHSLEDFINSEQQNQQDSKIADTILNYIDLLKEYFKNVPSDDDEAINKYKQRLESLSSIKSSVDYKVLIVELSKTLSSACERILRNSGIRVAVVKDGYEALGRLLREEFDCLITSKSVATINGIQLVQGLNIFDGPNKNISKILITTDKRIQISGPNCYTFIKDQELLLNLETFFKKAVNSLEEKKIESYQQAAKIQTKPLTRILCVDDDKLLQKVIKISLKSIPNIEIDCCTSPNEALKKVEESIPDLMILDVMMEEMSGVELSKRIKASHPDIPVIFLTGTSKPQDIKDLKDQGAIDVISKPFKPKILYEQVLAAWSNSQQD